VILVENQVENIVETVRNPCGNPCGVFLFLMFGLFGFVDLCSVVWIFVRFCGFCFSYVEN